MFTLKTHKDTIDVEPKVLCKTWRTKILDSLRKVRNRTVDSHKGVILSVERITSYTTPKVRNDKISITLEYEAISFVPSIGIVYPGEITMVIAFGVLVETEGLVRVLIKKENLPPNYLFEKNRAVFTNGIHSFGVGDKIRFKITEIKYKATEVQCLASLVDSREVDLPDSELEIIEPIDDFT